MQLTDKKQRLITSALTILAFVVSYPAMMALAGYMFDEVLLPLSKGSIVALMASALIVVIRDQLLKEEPDRSRRLRTVVEVSILATIIVLV